jgi:hypothetical protein
MSTTFGDDLFSEKGLDVPYFSRMKVNKKILVFLMQKVLLLSGRNKVIVLIGFPKTNFKKGLYLLSMDLQL